jgi:hypothetical protein
MPNTASRPRKAPAKAAPRKAAVTPAPRKAAAKPGAGSSMRVGLIEAALEELTVRFDTLLWLYVEKETKGRRDAAKLLLAQPQVQEAMVNGTPEVKRQIQDKLDELTK